MKALTVFENPEFGTIRTFELDGEPWLAGKDVAEALGYTNHRKALDDHVDPKDKMQGDGVTIRDGKIKAVKTERTVRIPEEEIERVKWGE